MEWLFGKKEPAQPPPLSKEQQTLKDETKLMSGLYQKVNAKCLKKCMAFKEQDITVGEGSCVDRCVEKYLEVNRVVSRRILSSPAGQLPF
eukprot:TRINITY_DN1395_c0_g1_i1.p1 TRINITY_DN1395_c0_g1~~TRINITY_DN1395_c0_g1_i1.p1  ORF type:complete len:105 (-),score=17.71 TRINITY_DN1395_c0_g1_i1:175-444(-)